uniref:Phospholipase A2 isozymes PA3A/PA3B/PA5 n=2 Tax=Lepeophtheirus salmonis TaxID=72036 RepID=D3PJI9_LEPSM|nr:Phospholipase A2 isozymes PA3A/PA3B/PA5 [Lepeophtheirus salmonis]
MMFQAFRVFGFISFIISSVYTWDNAYVRIQHDPDGKRIVTLMDFERIVNIYVEDTSQGIESVIDCNTYIRHELLLLTLKHEEEYGPRIPSISRERKSIDVGYYKRLCRKRNHQISHIYGTNDSPGAKTKLAYDRNVLSKAYEGTMFCTKYNPNYNPLVYNEGLNFTDECCRKFQTCGATIGKLQYQFDLLNVYPYNLKQCSCVSKFKSCLNDLQDSGKDAKLAKEIHRLFFDVLNMKCFDLEEQEICSKWSTWFDSCEEKKLIDSVHVKYNV